jgi:hypothetical protein
VKSLLLLGFAAMALLLPGAAILAAFGSSSGPADAPPAVVGGNAAAVLADPYPQLYQNAATTQCPGLDPHVLEAVGQVESGHNQNDGPSSAGAVGPMQFQPQTWTVYGDGIPGDVWLPPLAIPAAAKMICANAGGHPTDLGAIRKSLAIYNAGSPDSPAGLAYATHVLAVAIGADVLADSRLTLSDNARQDVQIGIDPRVDSILELAANQWPLSVGTIRTGHSTYVEGTDRVSEHICGRAVDLTAVGGAPISDSNAAAKALVQWTATLSGDSKPDEVGSLWPEFNSLPGHFVDPGTGPHIHLGFHGPACR